MEQPPQLDGAQDQHEIDRLLSRIDVGDILIGVGPQHHNLVGRPDRAAAHATPEDVVEQLITRQELAFPLCQPIRRVLELQPLRLARPQPQMPGADDQKQHHLVAHKDQQNPVGAKCRHASHFRLQVDHGQRGDDHVDEVPGKEVVVHPFQYLNRLGRPGEYGIGQLGSPFRLPVAPLIARHSVGQTLPVSTNVSHDLPPAVVIMWCIPIWNVTPPVSGGGIEPVSGRFQRERRRIPGRGEFSLRSSLLPMFFYVCCGSTGTPANRPPWCMSFHASRKTLFQWSVSGWLSMSR